MSYVCRKESGGGGICSCGMVKPVGLLKQTFACLKRVFIQRILAPSLSLSLSPAQPGVRMQSMTLSLKVKAYNANGEVKEHGLRVAHAGRVSPQPPPPLASMLTLESKAKRPGLRQEAPVVNVAVVKEDGGALRD